MMTFLCLHFVINEVEHQLCLDVYEMLAHILCPFSYWCIHLSYSFARALFYNRDVNIYHMFPNISHHLNEFVAFMIK